MRVLPPFLVAYLVSTKIEVIAWCHNLMGRGEPLQFAFMDRSNIGNARLGGLLDTTKMTEHEFQAGTVRPSIR
jgi:hypothetical protein